MPNLSGTSLGRYLLLEPLGEGGMAIVYKAYDTRLECDVAVKIIRTNNLPPVSVERALKRFEREAKSVARLTHPNIVKVMDYGEYEGSPYLVMPFLPGGTLKSITRQHGQVPWKEVSQLLIPVLEALDYAHENHIIHRDIKPSNILLTQKGTPMLTDFGVAKVIDEESTQDLTGTSATVGTPEYMAPEQITSKTVDARADLYALGVVFYEMVTGRRPYEADTPIAVLFKHASDPLPRPSQFVQDLPESVEKFLLKALAKGPADRYQNASEMIQALSNLLLIAQPPHVEPQPVGIAPKNEPKVVLIPQPSIEANDEQTLEQNVTPSKSQKMPVGNLLGFLVMFGLLGLAVFLINGFQQGWTSHSTWTISDNFQNSFSSTAPLPYYLSFFYLDEDGSVFKDIQVSFTDPKINKSWITNIKGEYVWNSIPSDLVEVTFSYPGYFEKKQTLMLSPGSNHILISLEKDPFGLMLEEACNPGEELLYLEDFQDGTAQGWQMTESSGWEIVEQPQGSGNFVIRNNFIYTHPTIPYEITSFPDSVWRLDFWTNSPATMLSLNWLQNYSTIYQGKSGVDLRYQVVIGPDGSSIHRITLPIANEEIAAGPGVNQDFLHRVEISRFNNQVQVWVDGVQILSYLDPEPLPPGSMSIEVIPANGSTNVNKTDFYNFDNLRVCKLNQPFITMPVPSATTNVRLSQVVKVANCDDQICLFGNNDSLTRVLKTTEKFTYFLGLSWAPDGNQIVFSAEPSDDNIESYHGLYVVNKSDSSVDEVINSSSSEENFPAWSPDGKWIAYGDNGNLAMIKPDGTERRVIDEHRNDTCNNEIAWSPDSSKIAFIGGTCSENYWLWNNIWVYDLEDNTLKRLLTGKLNLSTLAWNYDGTKIAFKNEYENKYLINTVCLQNDTCDYETPEIVTNIPLDWFDDSYPQWISMQ